MIDGDGALKIITLRDYTFVEYLKMNGILKQKAGNLVLPDFVFNNYSMFINFYCGLFDADGYASGKKKGYNLTIIDKKVIQELQTILLSCGIVGRIHVEDRSKKGWQTMYAFSICGAYSQKNIVNYFKNSVKIQKSSFISKKDSVISPYNARNLNIRYSKYSFCPDNSEYLSINTIDRVNSTRSKENMIQNDLFRDKISNICVENSLCVEISGIDSVWANGFIISSSIGDCK